MGTLVDTNLEDSNVIDLVARRAMRAPTSTTTGQTEPDPAAQAKAIYNLLEAMHLRMAFLEGKFVDSVFRQETINHRILEILGSLS